MATATVSLATATVTGVMVSSGSKTQKERSNVVHIARLNSYGGLKAHNSVASLGLPVCTEHRFAEVVSSLRATSHGKRKDGGALRSTCNAAGEIFKIAAITNALVLVGVAVGFVLLRIEAWVEESED
ncbi:Cytochrome b6-f complex subunit 7 [Morella rubra]|uniref:Cytochrome b6-f complex subunit 7 n=1 Tax=Morella rubra TaxID=262757 RepID=A0A6A1W581_9ROSI|nr:Cytochrome b6-f complex subunit 7 [Morella rubra]